MGSQILTVFLKMDSGRGVMTFFTSVLCTRPPYASGLNMRWTCHCYIVEHNMGRSGGEAGEEISARCRDHGEKHQLREQKRLSTQSSTVRAHRCENRRSCRYMGALHANGTIPSVYTARTARCQPFLPCYDPKRPSKPGILLTLSTPAVTELAWLV